MKICLCNFN